MISEIDLCPDETAKPLQDKGRNKEPEQFEPLID
jgi:hypothetical protein